MPNAMRQSGPRPALRHLAPANAPASRGLPAAAQRVGKMGSLPGLFPFSGREEDAVEIWLLLPKVVVRASTCCFPVPRCAVQVWGHSVLQHSSGNPDGFCSTGLGLISTPLQHKISVAYGFCFRRAAKLIFSQLVNKRCGIYGLVLEQPLLEVASYTLVSKELSPCKV